MSMHSSIVCRLRTFRTVASNALSPSKHWGVTTDLKIRRSGPELATTSNVCSLSQHEQAFEVKRKYEQMFAPNT